MERSPGPPDHYHQLMEELQAERRMKEMLQASIYERKNAIADLERKLSSVGDEGNEWKTRYETQIELNRQLERQIHMQQEKSEHIRGNPTDRLSSIRSYDQMPEGALNQYLKRLEDEKTLIENQLKDFELRIEQEAKAYYKVNDERRMYVSEISQTSVIQDAVKKQPADAVHVTRDNPGNKEISVTQPRYAGRNMSVGVTGTALAEATVIRIFIHWVVYPYYGGARALARWRQRNEAIITAFFI